MTNFEKVGSCNRVTADFSRNAFPETNFVCFDRSDARRSGTSDAAI